MIILYVLCNIWITTAGTDLGKNVKKMVKFSIYKMFKGVGLENVRNDQIKQFFMKNLSYTC